ncbi:MAG: hypothetical protein QOD99_1117 [Chthoniobacter sp.]|jgi:hypothetical protein|nr:hypothetical protein [Chthoniobacter sp.]
MRTREIPTILLLLWAALIPYLAFGLFITAVFHTRWYGNSPLAFSALAISTLFGAVPLLFLPVNRLWRTLMVVAYLPAMGWSVLYFGLYFALSLGDSL